MYSLRRWLYRPKRSDSSLLAQFYFADEELNLVAAELDSFEGRKDPERCTAMVNQLRACQARVLNVVSQMMDETVKELRAPRDFRVKFPDDVIQENLAGQLWFGAECLAAGSSIMNREVESACMRPLARALTKNLDSLRTILREQCLQSVHDYTDTIKESLIIFDKLFAEFELSYVSAMVPVKTAHEYDMIQEITVLFSETVQRALKVGLLTIDQIDEYDPALMFTIPRLAIICGVLIFKDGPLNPDNDPWNISEMFRPFQTLLLKIRELLSILTNEELTTLERALCSQDEPSFLISMEEKKKKASKEEKHGKGSKDDKSKKSKKKKKPAGTEEADGDDGSVESELTALEIAERLEALALNFEASRNAGSGESAAGQPTNCEPDAQSKSSDASSASTSSMPLSEGESGKKEAEYEAKSESASEELQSQQQVEEFTHQLYHEANLDSQGVQVEEDETRIVSPADKNTVVETPHTVTSEPYIAPLAPPLSAQQIPSSESEIVLSDSACDSQSEPEKHAKLSGTSDNEKVAESDVKDEAKANEAETFQFRDQEGPTVVPSMVKCNSNDSGLHSDGVSNSDSMYTIASSDSANHLVTTPNTPTSPKSFSQDIQQIDNANLASDTASGINGCLNSDAEDSALQGNSALAYGTVVNHSADSDSCNNNVNLKEEGSITNELMENSVEKEATFLTASEHTTSQENGSNSSECPNTLPSDTAHIAQSSILHSFNCDSLVTEGDSSSVPCGALSTTGQEKSDPSTACKSSLVPAERSVSTVVEDVSVTSSSYEPLCEQQKSKREEDSTSHPAQTVDSDCIASSSNGDANVSSQSSTVAVGKQNPPVEDKENLSNAQTESESRPSDDKISKSHNATKPKLKNCSSPSAGPSSASGALASSTSHSKDKPSRTKGKSSRKSSGVKGKKSSRARALMDEQLLDGECCNSSETSSYTSDCADQEEIALAMEAAEDATRQQVRARFRSSSDMIHRLFVCISGVADQLQTNFAGDLRNILRSVFDMNCSEPVDIGDGDKVKDTTPLGAAYIAISNASRNTRRNRNSGNQNQEPPTWIPDEECTECMSCQVPFSFMRRRHHCRNCGKIFCSRCSSNFVPLPHFGHEKCVRVCNRCFMFRVTPFTVRTAAQ